MDFYTVSNGDDFIFNPYAGKSEDGWIEGYTSVEFLNADFGQYSTATEMKNATTSEGLQLFFDYLVEQGKLSA
jgi:hypothetical protein